MTTKTQMMALVAKGLCNEVFHHATLGMFDVTSLRVVAAMLKDLGHKPLSCRFDEVRHEDTGTDPLAFLIANREVDRERVANLTEEQIEEPLIFVLCPAGTNGKGETHLLVDGIHRMVARHERGKEDFKFWLVPMAVAPRPEAGFKEKPWGNMEVRDGKLRPRQPSLMHHFPSRKP